MPCGVYRQSVNGSKPLGRDVLGSADELSTGVVDENVYPTRFIQNFGYQGIDLVGFPNVTRDGEAAVTIPGNLSGGFRKWLGPATTDCDVEAVARELDCGRPPYSSTAAGDDGDLGARRTHAARI